MRGLILKGLRSRFHFSLPTGLTSGRSEGISGPSPGPLMIPLELGWGVRFFIKFEPVLPVGFPRGPTD